MRIHMSVYGEKFLLAAMSFMTLVACVGENGDGPLIPDISAPIPDATVLDANFYTNMTNAGSTYTVNGFVTILTYDSAATTFAASDQDRSGMSLYIFDNDPVNESSCNSDQCVNAWPPLLASSDTTPEKPLSVITRDDGTSQWALRGKPLYFYSGDIFPADVNGAGAGGVWHVAKSEPAILVDDTVFTIEGEYLVASGDVSISVPENDGDVSAFVSLTADMAGMSLYTFGNDVEGVSNCFGACLVNWPALLADTGDVAETPFSIIDRQMNENGGTARQWAYHGKPLYFFNQDTAPGDTLGNDIANWTLSRPLPVMLENGRLVASGLVKSAATVSGEEVTSVQPKHGFTLYTFDNDAFGVSNCEGACLTNWPALIAHDGAVTREPYSLVARASGELQWAWNGKPLYFYHLDTDPGDAFGNGIGSVWHIVEF